MQRLHTGKLTNSEKRKYLRIEPKETISVQFKVITKAESDKVVAAKSHQVKTKNVSGGGMFLEIPAIQAELLEGVLQGTHNLFLEIDTPNTSYPIEALSKVVWVEGKASGKYGVGVSFMSINKTDRDRLMEYIIERALRS